MSEMILHHGVIKHCDFGEALVNGAVIQPLTMIDSELTEKQVESVGKFEEFPKGL